MPIRNAEQSFHWAPDGRNSLCHHDTLHRCANPRDEVDMMVAVQVSELEARLARAGDLRRAFVLDFAVTYATCKRAKEQGCRAEKFPGVAVDEARRTGERATRGECEVEANA